MTGFKNLISSTPVILSMIIIIIIIFILIMLIIYWRQGGKYRKKTTAVDKVVIVTGANTGIGKETVRELAKRGAVVYMACRNMKKAEEARQDIAKNIDDPKIICRELDLSSFASIRKFVENFKKESTRLDILINNAGVFCVRPRAETADGYELQFGVNHLGHFLLTNLLLDLLKQSAPSRIVVVSSSVYKNGRIQKEDLNMKTSYNALQAYRQSKLANILFTRELSKRLQGTAVTVNAVHPGLVHTDMARNFNSIIKLIIEISYYTFFWPFVKTPKNGAQTTICAALDPDLKEISGRYLSDCKIEELTGSATDDALANWLWIKSEELTSLRSA